MKITKLKVRSWTIISTVVLLVVLAPATYAWATKGAALTLSPVTEKIMLNPGEKYSSSVEIYIPAEYENDMKYNVGIAPYYVDENYNNDFNNAYGTNSEIMNWITFDTPKEGRLSPGQKAVIEYTINVPADAAGGGQYASILASAEVWNDENATNNDNQNNDEVGTSIKEVKKIAHIIYAEIAGDIVRQGEVMSIDVPGFLLSGDITGSTAIKNTGNVHGEAKYKLQVFPLFNDEEIYTNEEDPATAIILPDRTRYEETAWTETPNIGIFNVVYTVEFEGVTAQVSKLVIKCPIWLLFIILAIIAGIIIWIIMRIRARSTTDKNPAKREASTTEK